MQVNVGLPRPPLSQPLPVYTTIAGIPGRGFPQSNVRWPPVLPPPSAVSPPRPPNGNLAAAPKNNTSSSS